MATLDSLKQALRQQTQNTDPSLKIPLSDSQYANAFDTLRYSEWETYEDFIIPQLYKLLAPICKSRNGISVLEIGPGPESILGHLPSSLRKQISKYTAYEPIELFATGLEKSLSSTAERQAFLPCLEGSAMINRSPFALKTNTTTGDASDEDEKFDIILFCHSMYGMSPKQKFIKRAIELLVKRPLDALVIVFHRGGILPLNGLVCHQTASFPDGALSVADDNESLYSFAAFIAGYIIDDVDAESTVKVEWLKVCRKLGRREQSQPNRLFFSSPNIMAAFTQISAALPELMRQVPSATEKMAVKNREARLHRPAAIMRPTEVRHVQQCVRWALKHGVGLTVIGGGHGGQCLWPNVVAVDMSNFNAIHILPEEQSAQDLNRNSGPLVVVEAGCKTGDIIGSTMGAGVTVPLGSRPSVGAGLWLQGGIGHLARIHGLACDSIVGAVVVSVSSGHIVYAGCVPSQYRPAGAVLAENESDLLWAIKGAGTNFGIVVSVTFESHKALKFLTRNWILPLKNSREAEIKLNEFDSVVAKKLTRNNSADAYLYWDAGKLHLGVTVYESSTKEISYTTHTSGDVSAVLGMEHGYQIVDAVGLFDTEMYMSRMHGGHSGGKTSSFKRCVFLKNIGEANIANRLIAAIEARPASFCYLHLLHGGGAVTDIAPEATAFGCRDWDFACVITSVWPRDQDGGEVAQAAVTWVYSVVEDLSSLSCGVYGADLGPDPRDAALAARAFGPNLPRLAKLKRDFDPHNVLAYACPLPRATTKQRLIILITGESFAGKDYCAEIWLSAFNRCSGVKAKVVSISSATKREYAVATGASITLLLNDRTYKEQHREALTAFFNEQLKQRPQMLSEQFLDAVQAASDVDVLMISGMREDAPVARYSHLVPDSRLIEVYIETSQQTRQIRRGHYGIGNYTSHNDGPPKRLNYRPTFTFHNNKPGTNPPKQFFETHLLPILHTDLERLTKQVRHIPNFPHPPINFAHILGIAQQPGGLALCTSLLESHINCKYDAIVCCEAGGFIYASALASRVNVPLVLIREAGKLPPPVVSVVKPRSHISSVGTGEGEEKRIEMERGLIPGGSSVLVVDDVLATGVTLCAVLELLGEDGVGVEDVNAMVVAEFPVHQGRELLRKRGFGRVGVQSLLVFEDA